MMKLLNINNADMSNMTCPMRGLFHNSPTLGPRPAVNIPHHPFSALVPNENGNHNNNRDTLPPALLAPGARSPKSTNGNNGDEDMEEGEYDEDDDLQPMTNNSNSNHNTNSNINRKRRKSVCYTNRQRKRPLQEFMSNNNDDEIYAEDGRDERDDRDDSNGEEEEEEEKYPEVGVRATATIQVAKELFVGHHSMHRGIAREMVLEALKQIAEYRWIHEKYDIDADTVRYLVFLDEDLKIPIEFEETKPKRGRPPKHKKARTNENGKDMKEYNEDPEHDKLYRLNFQIIFEREVEEEVRSEIVQNMKIDLNQTSLSMLLSRVLSVRIDITERVQAYSLYAVEAGKLKEYEKYEAEEEARKKKKREREQKR